MKKFNLNEYKDKNVVMLCRTKEEAIDFCNTMDEYGIYWVREGSHILISAWDKYKDFTCYNFNEGTYADKYTYEEMGYEILQWSDFMEEEINKEIEREEKVIQEKKEKFNSILQEIIDDFLENPTHKAFEEMLELSENINRTVDTMSKLLKSKNALEEMLK